MGFGASSVAVSMCRRPVATDAIRAPPIVVDADGLSIAGGAGTHRSAVSQPRTKPEGKLAAVAGR